MQNHTKVVQPRAGRKTSHEIIAKLGFIIFLFFAFFGTSIPFQEEISDIDDISTSNIVNQLLYGILFLTSLYSLIPLRLQLFQLIKREKWLTIFLVWCMLSIVWSEFSFVSFKRLFQTFTAILVSTSVLLHTKSFPEILRFFKWILLPYVLLSMAAILLIPGAIDAKFMTWRGMSATKNTFAQACLICIIVWFNIFRQEDFFKKKIIAFSMLLLSIIMLIGSQSGTSLITFSVLTGVSLVIMFFNGLFGSFTLSRFLVAVVLLSGAAIIASTIVFAPDILTRLPYLIGKDITFSGRVDLWIDILNEVKKHPILGCGYAGFWVVDNVDLLILFEKYVWLPNQAHSGYVDILNETGIVGLALLIIMLVFYYKNLFGLKEPHFWKWFILAAILINLQETTFFRTNNLFGNIFIFAYLALYTKLVRDDTSEFT